MTPLLAALTAGAAVEATHQILYAACRARHRKQQAAFARQIRRRSTRTRA